MDWPQLLYLFITITCVSHQGHATNSPTSSKITPDSDKSDTENEIDSSKDKRQEFDWPSSLVQPYYVFDKIMSEELALTEEKLIQPLSDISRSISPVSEADNCKRFLDKYLHEYAQDTRAVKETVKNQRATMVTENPILIFKMIRRIYKTLLNDTITHCHPRILEILKTVKQTFTRAGISPPTEEDLNDALEGLLRIQYIYGLNATKEVINLFQFLKPNWK